MADIAGFRGVRYDRSRVEMSRVLAPPYDVIDEDGRKALAAKDPHSCIELILPTAAPGQGEDSKYQHAAQLMSQWLEEGVLQRDEQPAVYRYHQVYTRPELGPDPVTRRGFIAAVRLHDFDERVILRHERTLAGPKVDRLKLWDATRTHLSQIFTLYSDPASEVDAFFAEAESHEPTVDGTTDDGTRHILWRVDDPALVDRICKAMAPKHLYIADGHHRYETMLALRNRLLEAAPEAGPRSEARFGMMFLANMDDPGLLVLPTHRMIHSVADFDAAHLLEGLARYFELRTIAGGARDAANLREQLEAAASQGPSFAAVLPGSEDATLLVLRPEIDLRGEGLTGSDETLALDVTLLHDLVLDGILGIDRAAQEAQTNIDYIKDTQVALDEATAGRGQVCFLMNATPVRQVVAVSDADDIMPQKSTFFYPKIASGLVFNPIDPAESL